LEEKKMESITYRDIYVIRITTDEIKDYPISVGLALKLGALGVGYDSNVKDLKPEKITPVLDERIETYKRILPNIVVPYPSEWYEKIGLPPNQPIVAIESYIKELERLKGLVNDPKIVRATSNLITDYSNRAK